MIPLHNRLRSGPVLNLGRRYRMTECDGLGAQQTTLIAEAPIISCLLSLDGRW